MTKFTSDTLPPLARSYRGEKQKRFLDMANFAFDMTDDESVALLAGMMAAGEDRNAEIRARMVNQVDQFEQAKRVVAEFADEGNTIDAEIFAVGTWNKRWSFSTADLDQIVASFAELKTMHRVPLKFGHNEQQAITDGQPALGWVSEVWRKDTKLMARFTNVPNVVKNAIKAKLYRQVSVELDVDARDHKGKKHKYILSAVALLGADRPAVKTLADLDTYVDGAHFQASSREVFSAIKGNRKSEVKDMDENEVQAAIEKAMKPMADKLDAVTRENETLKAENAKFKASEDDAKKAIQTEKVKSHRAALVGKFEAAVKAKQFTPAQRESAIKVMRIDDDANVLAVTEASVDEYIKVNGGKLNMSDEQGRGAGGNSGSGSHDDPGAEIVRLAEIERAKFPTLTFAQCRDMVIKANPELGSAWMGMVEEAEA